jgi:hypothetical protein
MSHIAGHLSSVIFTTGLCQAAIFGFRRKVFSFFHPARDKHVIVGKDASVACWGVKGTMPVFRR